MAALGLDGAVYAIAVSGNNVYVGGTFTNAGGVAANNIALWNGSAWSTLDAGIASATNLFYTPIVSAIAVSGGNVYVGGNFTNAGAVAALNVAQWDGSHWSALGAGVGEMGAGVLALAMNNGLVYAGGAFQHANGTNQVNSIAAWNGTRWSALGTGIGGTVAALAVGDNNLYAGGRFTTAGGISSANLAVWNGSTWAAVGGGVGTNLYDSVASLAVAAGNLYVGGMFDSVDGLSATNLAVWTGSHWAAVGSDALGGNVNQLAADGSNLYVSGYFHDIGHLTVNHLAKWNGSRWSALTTGLGLGVDGDVYALAVSGSQVYVGGTFRAAGNVSANNIAVWNGGAWAALGSGVGTNVNDNGRVNAISISGTDVYVGGVFSNAGAVAANNIAKWNGGNWSALGAGLGAGGYLYSAMVEAIAISGTNVFVGGSFTNAGNVTVNNIARWDGARWNALGSGINNSVYALALTGNDLYAGGVFTNAGGISANNIAHWNGSSWSALGAGVGNPTDYCFVLALAVRGTNVYVGGTFTNIGAGAVNGIARWDGAQWNTLGSSIAGGVTAIGISGTNVYAGGWFAEAGGVSNANSIAVWNGINWATLGSGVRLDIYALAVGPGKIYGGGGFGLAGAKPAASFAAWQESSAVTPPATNAVATPILTPPSGTYTDSVPITLTCTTPRAVIRYTVNGDAPTTNSPIYKKAFQLTNALVTVQAQAFKAGLMPSDVAVENYQIILPTITTGSSLPNGQRGAAYGPVTLSVTNGVRPYKWALVAGSKLPLGLTLSSAGVISGKPKTAQLFTFTVKVTDSKKGTAQKQFSLMVN